MRGRVVLAAGVAASVVLASVASAGPAASKQRVAIDAELMPAQTFVLLPRGTGKVKPDSGAITGNWRTAPGRDVIQDGQKVGLYTNTWTLTGKRGTITIREQIRWVDTGADANDDGNVDGVALGTWKVVKGTGAYTGVTGKGGSGHAGLGNPWNARFEGILTVP
jgi:hypothetical protein